MSKPLVIVESEAKARSIKAQLGEDFQTLVVAAPTARAVYRPPVDPRRRDSLEFDFTPLAAGRELLGRLAAEPPSRELLLAFDSDRQGEYLAWLLNGCLQRAGGGRRSLQRLRPLGLEAGQLRAAMQISDLIVDQEARSQAVLEHFDDCLERHLRRLLGTASGPRGLSLNLATLLTVVLLQEREDQIKARTAEPGWQVRVRVAAAGGEFDLRLAEVFGITDEGVFRRAEQARTAVEMLRHQPLRVKGVERRPLPLPPSAPFSLTELLAAAQRLEGLGPGRVRAALVGLHQGLAVRGEAACGLVSFWSPRLDRLALAGLLAQVRQLAARRWGEEALGAKTVAPPGSVLPLRPEWSPEDLAGELEPDQALLYRLLHQRALASQLAAAQVEEVALEVAGGKHCLLRATGRRLLAPGFLTAEPAGQWRELLTPSPLADLEQGRELELVRIVPEQLAAPEADFYTMETLAEELADFALAPGSDLPELLHELAERDYLTLGADGTLQCRENSRRLLAVLARALPAMHGMNLLAYCDQTVLEVFSGRKSLRAALQQLEQTLMIHGRVLVKAQNTLATAVAGRASSSSVIKKAAVASAPVAEPTPASAPDAASATTNAPPPEAVVSADEPEPVAESAPEPPPEPTSGLDAAAVIDRQDELPPALAGELGDEYLREPAETSGAPQSDVEPAPTADLVAEPEAGELPAPAPSVPAPPTVESPAAATPPTRLADVATAKSPVEPAAAATTPDVEQTPSAEPVAAAPPATAAAEESQPAAKRKVLVRRLKGGAAGGKRKLVRVVKRK